ncbi:MAG: heparan-alpha-glucosaminide N-acetyltransferase domain-containing protein [Planctomycetaceae bacterium]|nr:heparan-alpha-glucosaminide N-acetyltransferase domain-containing protein [Planctomycetaceae bacterium]
MDAVSKDSSRLASLDQFRGYTVLGMFLVNFVGSYVAIGEFLPILKHHHTYCSYADTIMPQFFFAVGFAYRMTFLRRMEREGAAAAYWHATKRVFALLLVALVVHTLGKGVANWELFVSGQGWKAIAVGLKRDYFQTLTHIAVTSLWVMPVIAARPGVRVLFMIGSAALFHLLSHYWYYDWVNMAPKGIDGGPLGFLTWTIPLVVGTLAYDAMSTSARPPVTRLLVWGAVLMLLAYALACLNRVTPPNNLSAADGWMGILVEPPFVPPADDETVNVWTMSQRSGSATYLTFGAGFALVVYALFVQACDVGTFSVGVFRTLGTNALAGYILHDLVAAAVKPWVPKDSPLWWVAIGFGLFLAVCYVILRYMERHKLYLRL